MGKIYSKIKKLTFKLMVFHIINFSLIKVVFLNYRIYNSELKKYVLI